MPSGLWETRTIGDCARAIVGGGTPSRIVERFWNGPIPWASVKDFTDDSVDLHRTQESITEAGLSKSTARLVAPHNPIVCMRMAVGRVAAARQSVAINQDLKAVLPASDLDPRYLLYALKHLRPRLAAGATGSTVKGITLGDLTSSTIGVPHVPEQRQIAAILDTIDEAILKTEQVIDKLQQMKQGLLHDLLTRGIDENGELRDPERYPEQFKESELGRIPRAWEVRRAAEFCESVADGTHDTPRPQHSGMPLITSRNLKNGRLNWEGVYCISHHDYKVVRSRSWVQPGDILYGMIGTIGNPVLLADGEDEIAPKNVGIFRFAGDRVRAEWFRNSLESIHVGRQIEEVLAGSTQKFVGLGTLRSLLVPETSSDEAARCNAALSAAAHRQESEAARLTKMHLLKQGLMDDLLTGRVRVPIAEQATA